MVLVINNLGGFRVYSSSNLPAVGTGPGTSGSANQIANYGVIVAGHDSAVATAEQINKTETYRDPDSFLTLFVVCIYMVERYFVLKLSLLPNITQRRGNIKNGYITSLLLPATGNSNRGRMPYQVELIIDLTAQAIDCSAPDTVQCITLPANTHILHAGVQVVESATMNTGTNATITLGCSRRGRIRHSI